MAFASFLLLVTVMPMILSIFGIYHICRKSLDVPLSKLIKLLGISLIIYIFLSFISCFVLNILFVKKIIHPAIDSVMSVFITASVPFILFKILEKENHKSTPSLQRNIVIMISIVFIPCLPFLFAAWFLASVYFQASGIF